jgi:hypothetical protein
MNSAELDAYLARTLAAILRSEAAAPWPAELGAEAKPIAQRIAFHGITLLIAQTSETLASWPPAIARAVREQAGIQTFWETSHRMAIAPLIEALAAAEISAVITKGTALAYSVYPDPAVRRRGDTDILVQGSSQEQVRQVLRACGFAGVSDIKALQESWQRDTAFGFSPAVDIHWRINASAFVSQMLERGLRFDTSIPLDRLSPNARGVGPVDNLILTAINRGAHAVFGYNVGPEQVFEADRLIWALDVHLLAGQFAAGDWDDLVERASLSGAASMVRASLAFARRTLGTAVPEAVDAALSQVPADQGLGAYFGLTSHIQRLQLDLAACGSIGEGARVLRYVAFPSEVFLQSRFPDAEGWPRPVLHLRRWIEGTGRLLGGKA